MTLDLHVRRLPPIPGDLRPLVDSMCVAFDWEKGSYLRRDPPGQGIAGELGLLAMKCRASWNLLIMLHEMQRTASGPLPGVEWDHAHESCRELARQEMELVNRTAGDYLDRFYGRIWSASSVDEIRWIGLEATMMTKGAAIYS